MKSKTWILILWAHNYWGVHHNQASEQKVCMKILENWSDKYRCKWSLQLLFLYIFSENLPPVSILLFTDFLVFVSKYFLSFWILRRFILTFKSFFYSLLSRSFQFFFRLSSSFGNWWTHFFWLLQILFAIHTLYLHWVL